MLAAFSEKEPHDLRETEQIDFMLEFLDCHEKLAMYWRAEAGYEEFLEDDKVQDRPVVNIRLLNGLARIKVIQGKFADASADLKKAKDIAQRNKLDSSSYAIESIAILANLNFHKFDLFESEKGYKTVLSKCNKNDADSERLKADALDGLTQIHRLRCENKTARELADESMHLRTKLFGEDSMEAAASMESIALLQESMDPGEAGRLRLKALSILKQKLGTTAHPRVAKALLELMRSFQEPYSAKEFLCQSAMRSVDGILGSESPFQISCLDHLSYIYMQQERLTAASETCLKTIELKTKVFGANSFPIAESLYCRAYIEFFDALERNFALKTEQSDSFLKCRKTIEEAIRISNETLGEKNFESVNYLCLLGTIAEKQEDYVVSESAFKKALRIIEGQMASRSLEADEIKQKLSRICAKLGKKEEAREFIAMSVHDHLERSGVYNTKMVDLLRTWSDLEGEHSTAEGQKLNLLMRLPGIETGIFPIRINDGRVVFDDNRRKLLEEYIANYERKYGSDSPRVSRKLTILADFYVRTKDYSRAEEIFKRILSIEENAFGHSHPALVWTLSTYADMLQKAGREKESSDLIARAESIKKASQ